MTSFNLRRWTRWIALALVFSVACGFLANWQLDRRTQIVKVIQRVERNYDHQRVGLATMVPIKSSFKLSREYRRVWVAGRYLSLKPTLIRNRPMDGDQGFQEVFPFQLTSGEVIFIDRGWLPTGDSPSMPNETPVPSGGNVTLVGRLRQAEPLDSRSAPSGQAQSITPSALAKRYGVAPGSLYSGCYLLLEQESPAAAFGKLAQKPSLDEGNHLSYAFQWVIFAIMSFLAIAWGIRQERLQLKAANDPGFVVKKRKRVGDADKEAEDAILGD